MSKPMIYLDNAATSYPKPERVYEKIIAFGKSLGANPGRALYKMAVDAGEEYEKARRAVARFFGVGDPARIVFTMNATDGTNMALKGILRAGDHVVSSTFEHTCVLRPLNRMEKEGRIELTRVPPEADGRLSPERIAGAMQKNTRLVVVTHVSNVIGILQPVKEIAEAAHGRGALVMIDSAQATGVVPMDVEELGMDVMVTTGHKALFGPPGTGVLYVREGVDISPWREGGTGDSEEFQPEKFPVRLEGGTLNTWGVVALAEGIRFLEEVGVENVHEKESRLAGMVFAALGEDERIFFYGPPDAPRIGILSFNLRGVAPSVVGNVLDERFGICVRTGLHCAPGAHALYGQPEGCVRLSPGWFTTEEDIKTFIGAVREIADELAKQPAGRRGAAGAS
jgi:cysteine desulfurase family protein